VRRSPHGQDAGSPPRRPDPAREFAYDRVGLSKGGLGTIFVNGKKVAEGWIEKTQPMIFSADETSGGGG
jgi:arylsulfatase